MAQDSDDISEKTEPDGKPGFDIWTCLGIVAAIIVAFFLITEIIAGSSWGFILGPAICLVAIVYFIILERRRVRLRKDADSPGAAEGRDEIPEPAGDSPERGWLAKLLSEKDAGLLIVELVFLVFWAAILIVECFSGGFSRGFSDLSWVLLGIVLFLGFAVALYWTFFRRAPNEDPDEEKP